MRLSIYCLIGFLGLSISGITQKHGASVGTLSTGYSGTGSNIDVKYHKCFWRVNPDTSLKYIKGYVQTKFVTIEDNVSSISFDLNDALLVDSIIYNGKVLSTDSIDHSGYILTVALGKTLPKNKLDSITIYYQGEPPVAAGAVGGYSLITDPITGQNYIATLSESYEDRDWWPCKADMKDKIDSIDIFVNVPWSGADTFWVASNGRLLDSAINNGNRTFHFKSTYPIASYLVCFAAARYNRYYRGTVTVGGVKVPVVYNILRGKNPSQYTSIVSAMDRITAVVTAFSKKFGDYPFKADKTGFYEGLVGADGMEHQTFSAIASNALQDITTLVHELGHQWFGDNVTFSTWNDLWLAEGFARYSEILGAELVPTLGQNAVNKRINLKASAINLNFVSTRIPDNAIGSSNQIWSSAYGSAVYNRGGMVVSMLRAIAGDSLFFLALKNYQSSPGLAYKSATTDSLKLHFNKVLGRDITPFFTDYVWGKGNPTYNLSYQFLIGNKLSVSVVSQTQSAASTVSYFRTPVVLRIQGQLPSQDTLITFFDWGNGNLSFAGKGLSAPVSGNLLTYKLSFTPKTVTFDPYAYTMVEGSVALDLKIVNFSVVKKESTSLATLVLDDNIASLPIHLERSRDGVHFSLIGRMKKDATVKNATYQAIDEHLLSGKNYYRTSFKAENGQTKFSSIVEIDNALKEGFTIVENPVKQQLTIRIINNSTSNDNCYFIIYDTNGKQINKTAQKNNGDVLVNTSHFSKGVYVVSMFCGKTVLASKQFAVE